MIKRLLAGLGIPECEAAERLGIPQVHLDAWDCGRARAESQEVQAAERRLRLPSGSLRPLEEGFLFKPNEAAPLPPGLQEVERQANALWLHYQTAPVSIAKRKFRKFSGGETDARILLRQAVSLELDEQGVWNNYEGGLGRFFVYGFLIRLPGWRKRLLGPCCGAAYAS